MTTDSKHELEGSKSKDRFLFNRKSPRMAGWLYFADVDGVMICKHPNKIVALIDYKTSTDGITFAECIAYNDLMKHYPIYIIMGDPDYETLDIYKYEGGDPTPEPPIVKLVFVKRTVGMKEYERWEMELRWDSNGIKYK
jgi:hypothetical protein